MIYIDPPYNTGNDFIYEDIFAEDTEAFLQRSNQKDEEGNRLVANTESNGLFHSNWLTMIYPRLRLARNLLQENGVIFISIDDGEVGNLRKICDEIFGESNFVANVIWEKKFSPQNDAKWLSDNHDHILIYAKNKELWRPFKLPRTDENNSRFSNPDNDPRGVWASSDMTVKTYNVNYDYPIMTPGGIEVSPTKGRCWAMPKQKFLELIADNRVWFGVNGSNVPRFKTFLSELTEGIVPLTIWKHSEVGHNQEARQENKKLFGEYAYFDSPKPMRLIKRAAVISTQMDDIVLDFFSGSGTTAHSVIQLNAEDGGNRKFIMVQLPEPCDEKSEAFKAGYKTIAEIGKERIRRAGNKIKEENPLTTQNLDIGFRVFKVDTSNMKDVYYTPDELKQGNLDLFKDHIKPDRSQEDLLFQVFVDWGLDLTMPIAKETIDGKSIFLVDSNALIACFESGITEELVKKLAKHKPLRVVFRDDAFGSDSVKINVEQIFKLLSPGTEVKSI
jgi:adenine-specific DNA-methyltransferase